MMMGDGDEVKQIGTAFLTGLIAVFLLTGCYRTSIPSAQVTLEQKTVQTSEPISSTETQAR